MNQPDVDHYWRQYLQTLPPDSEVNPNYWVDQFGDTPELANELGQLVLAGLKTATCSALWEWEAEQHSLPEVGMHTVILDGNKNPLCIIATTAVRQCPFNEVDEQMAYAEGEDDRTLASWRRGHWNYFSRVLPKIGKEPTPDMVLIYEQFRVVYRSPS